MVRLRDLDLGRSLADPARKADFVTPMFALIAPRYDDFTRLFSFGMDAGWKRTLVAGALAACPRPRQVVDLACGTGDLALAVAAAARTPRVTGVDASREMLTFANVRATAAGVSGRVAFEHGDLGRLILPTASADLVTAGYAFRNGPTLDVALREVARITRPGGVLGVLDFYRPERALWRRAFLAYLRAAGNLVGWWWHREPIAYGYIAASVDAFVTANGFTRAACDAGFRLLRLDTRLGGGIAIHLLIRDA